MWRPQTARPRPSRARRPTRAERPADAPTREGVNNQMGENNDDLYFWETKVKTQLIIDPKSLVG